MAAPAFHESLPYIDTPSEAELASARALVAQEAQATPRGDTSQQAAPEPAFSEAIQTELARVASSTALTPLDTSRYEAQDLPPPGKGTGAGDAAPVLGRAYTSAAYLRSRLQNLELLERHGAPAWLLANYHLEAALGRAEAELARTKGEVDEVNGARRRRQADVAAEMAGLEETWRTGVGRVLETELAVEELRASIREELRKKGALSG
ncbi:hypothetical protein MHUMG1_06632 [Metarhizium humberi]|uniref:BCAS2 family protein n=1 Tax=Metarhizium humberi TaxID=2596975 RepID=A0A9P8S642_9HYPO|nr:hypothetical protein MHUMG1_06632 [Metarhizium humberi]